MKTKKKLIRHKKLWSSNTYLPELNRSYDHFNPMTKVEITCHSYTCPICGKRRLYFIANGHVIKGGYSNMDDQDYCLSRKCEEIVAKRYS